MYEASPIHGTYDYRLVTLSIMIAVCSAYAALDLSGQLYVARATRRLAWLTGGSFAMGAGIWGMHYVGMQAFLLPVPVLYDWPTVLLSIAAAILASAAALFAVSHQQRSVAGTAAASLVMGLGIAAMHYTGMEAMRLPAMHSYSPFLFTLSIAVAIGVRLSIDDFGTGYSMMQQLHHIPANEIKIDKSLIQNMRTANDRVMIEKVIELGRDLDMTVVAEGVETRDQLDFLHGKKCDIAQGYYFSKPLRGPDFLDWLEVYQAKAK